VAGNPKRTMVAFAPEVTCLVFAYLAYLLWNGIRITGSTFSNTLLLGFLSTLFALNYAIISRQPVEKIDENETADDAAYPGTKRE